MSDVLPPRVRELVEVVGLTPALRLVDSFGGSHVWVPQSVGAEHQLTKLIGRDAADRLVGRYQNSRLAIPRCAGLIRRERNRQILRLRQQGASGRAIARHFRMTARNVWYILARGDADPDAECAASQSHSRQLPLFERAGRD